MAKKNPKVTVHVETTSRDAFFVLETLSRARQCAYCSKDNAVADKAVGQFIDALRASLVEGITAELKTGVTKMAGRK